MKVLNSECKDELFDKYCLDGKVLTSFVKGQAVCWLTGVSLNGDGLAATSARAFWEMTLSSKDIHLTMGSPKELWKRIEMKQKEEHGVIFIK